MGMDAVGNLFLRTNVSYTDTFEIQTLEGDPTVDYIHTISVGNSHPRWKSMTDVGYQNESFTFGLRWRYLESMDDVTVITTPATPCLLYTSDAADERSSVDLGGHRII